MFNAEDPGPDYELAWPAELFAAEVDAVAHLRARPWANAAELLLTEAFTRHVPAADLSTVTATDLPGEVPSLVIALSQLGDAIEVKREFLRRLGQASDQFPRASSTRPYWPTRVEAPPVDPDDQLELERELAANVREAAAA